VASNKHGDFNVERSLNQEHGDVAQHGAYLKKTNTYFDYISYIKFYLPKDSKMGAVPHLIWHHALDQRLALHRQVVLFDCDAFTQKFYKAKWLDCQNGQSSGGFDLTKKYSKASAMESRGKFGFAPVSIPLKNISVFLSLMF